MPAKRGARPWCKVLVLGELQSDPRPLGRLLVCSIETMTEHHEKELQAVPQSLTLLIAKVPVAKAIIHCRRGNLLFVEGNLVYAPVHGSLMWAVSVQHFSRLMDTSPFRADPGNPSDWKDLLKREIKSINALENLEQKDE